MNSKIKKLVCNELLKNTKLANNEMEKRENDSFINYKKMHFDLLFTALIFKNDLLIEFLKIEEIQELKDVLNIINYNTDLLKSFIIDQECVSFIHYEKNKVKEILKEIELNNKYLIKSINQ